MKTSEWGFRNDRPEYLSPGKMEQIPAEQGLWYETGHEVAGGLRWGRRKQMLLTWVRREMQNLTEREREGIELHYFQSLSYRQMGAHNGTSPQAAYYATTRAIAKLRAAAIEAGYLSTRGKRVTFFVRASFRRGVTPDRKTPDRRQAPARRKSE